MFLDALTYGEVNYPAFLKLLLGLPVDIHEAVFFDIGSGTGRGVLTAACAGFKYAEDIRLRVFFNRTFFWL